MPGLEASSPRRSAVSGVCSAGLSTIVQPAASAGAELPCRHQQREVPRDDLPAYADRLLARVTEHVGRARPGIDLALRCAPASRRSSGSGRPCRATSTNRASLTGLPLSSDSSSASSSPLASIRSASRVQEPAPRVDGAGLAPRPVLERAPRGRATARSTSCGAGLGDRRDRAARWRGRASRTCARRRRRRTRRRSAAVGRARDERARRLGQRSGRVGDVIGPPRVGPRA